MNLLSTLQDDLEDFNLSSKSVNDIEEIRLIARNRSRWKQMFNFSPI